MDLLTPIQDNQSELDRQMEELNAKIERNKYAYTQNALVYHKVLLKLKFYKRYIFYSKSNKPLNTMFNLGSMQGSWLPEADHGEGDYVKILFKVNNDKLNLLYRCSYEQGDVSLIRIPLELFDQEDKLVEFLEAFYIESDQTHQRILSDKKQLKLWQLQEEIKKLKE